MTARQAPAVRSAGLVRRPWTVGDVVAGAARRDGSALAVADATKRLTWSEVDQRANKLANFLLEQLGLRRGDRVAVMSENRAEYLEVSYAVAKAACVVAPVNGLAGASLVESMVADMEPAVIVHSARFRELAERVADVAGASRIDLDGPAARSAAPAGPWAHEQVLAGGSALPPDVDVDPDELRGLVYTSGTSGRPKGVMLSHRNVMCFAAGLNTACRMTPFDRHLLIFPMGLISGVTVPATHGYYGGAVVMLENFEPAEVLAAIEARRITTLALPVFWLRQLLEAARGGGYDTTSLRLIMYGGEPIRQELLAEAVDAFSCEFVQSYGMTETTGNLFYLLPEDHHRAAVTRDAGRRRLRSVGREGLHVQARLIDEDGLPVGPESPGELVVRSEQVMMGYWRRPEETALALPDGWFHTGDVFSRDADGYHYILGRRSDVIDLGDGAVFPAEIENALLDHPAVAEAAVVGVPGADGLVRLCASVRAQRGATISAEEILAHCARQLPAWKQPAWVRLTDDFPRSGLGKIARGQLREQVIAESRT